MSHRVRMWWPVIVWMAVIGTLTTLPVAPGVWRGILPHLDKLAHFLLYLGLGWLLARAVWLSGNATGTLFLVALLGGVTFAAADEWHQVMLATRQATLGDWLADASGVALGLCLYLCAGRRRRLVLRGRRAAENKDKT